MLINLAIIKHGLENFSLYILEYCSVQDVIQREQYYLETYKPIYNILKIARYFLGYTHNEAFLTKMRSRVISEATISKMITRIQSEETRCKINNVIGIPVKIINIATGKRTIYTSKK